MSRPHMSHHFKIYTYAATLVTGLVLSPVRDAISDGARGRVGRRGSHIIDAKTTNNSI